MVDNFQIFPIGIISKKENHDVIEIYEQFQDALLGLEQFSHIILLSWFHENDKPEYRKTLRVHPRGDKKNPLTGIFATRSPKRPNLIAFFICEIISINDNLLTIEKTEAFAGTPVIDIKPYLPRFDSKTDIKFPEWIKNKNEVKNRH